MILKRGVPQPFGDRRRSHEKKTRMYYFSLLALSRYKHCGMALPRGLTSGRTQLSLHPWCFMGRHGLGPLTVVQACVLGWSMGARPTVWVPSEMKLWAKAINCFAINHRDIYPH